MNEESKVKLENLTSQMRKGFFGKKAQSEQSKFDKMSNKIAYAIDFVNALYSANENDEVIIIYQMTAYYHCIDTKIRPVIFHSTQKYRLNTPVTLPCVKL